jgi:hypothetical protein
MEFVPIKFHVAACSVKTVEGMCALQKYLNNESTRALSIDVNIRFVFILSTENNFRL